MAINRINTETTGPVKLPKPCSFCKGLGHLAFGCTKKPRKPMTAKKPMKKIGAVGKKLIDQRKEYLKAFPKPHYCYYCVYLGIDEELEEKDVQVEHFLTKNNHPGKRFDWSNLVKSCAGHNKLKGAMDGPEFLKFLEDYKEKEWLEQGTALDSRPRP